jgi:uncharacterized protein YbcI
MTTMNMCLLTCFVTNLASRSPNHQKSHDLHSWAIVHLEVILTIIVYFVHKTNSSICLC